MSTIVINKAFTEVLKKAYPRSALAKEEAIEAKRKASRGSRAVPEVYDSLAACPDLVPGGTRTFARKKAKEFMKSFNNGHSLPENQAYIRELTERWAVRAEEQRKAGQQDV